MLYSGYVGEQVLRKCTFCMRPPSNNNLLTQLIKEQTRVTNTSKTINDHIWVNNTDFYATSGCLDLGLSDHHLVYVSGKRAKIKKNTCYIHSRSYRQFDEQSFYNDMSHINWLPLYVINDIDHAVDYVNRVLLSVFDKHAPVKKIKCKSDQPKWITGDFLSCIDTREHLSNVYSKTPTPYNEACKRDAVRQVKCMKNQLKHNYVAEALAECRGDSNKRGSWSKNCGHLSERPQTSRKLMMRQTQLRL